MATIEKLDSMLEILLEEIRHTQTYVTIPKGDSRHDLAMDLMKKGYLEPLELEGEEVPILFKATPMGYNYVRRNS